jgi:hypothetical protein
MKTGAEVETWLRFAVARLQMSSRREFDLDRVIVVCEEHIPGKVKQAKSFQWDATEVDTWLDQVIKIDQLIQIEDENGDSHLVGIDVTADAESAATKMRSIDSHSFRQVRRDLGIDNHWVLIIDADNLPEDGRLGGAFYEAVDSGKECLVVNARCLI